MWSKISNVLKSRTHEESSSSNVETTTGSVLGKVLDQHPNLSMFHQHQQPTNENIPLPPTPVLAASSISKGSGGRRSMFKRMSKATALRDELTASGGSGSSSGSGSEGGRVPSPLTIPKGKSSLNLKGKNGSQLSLAVNGSTDMMRSPQDIPRRASFDMLREKSSSFDVLQDVLRPSQQPEQQQQPRDSPDTPYYASTRSILREPNTPGTGQNVRFFSRDAYKVISPDVSTEPDYQPIVPIQDEEESSFLRGLQRQQEISSTPRRPTVAEVFSPLSSGDTLPPIPAPDFANIFDMSQGDDLPSIRPAPQIQDSAVEVTDTETETEPQQEEPAFTSTPHKSKLTGVDDDAPLQLTVQQRQSIDETIFHSMEKSPKMPPGLLPNRSNSFSLGQTGFFTTTSNTTTSSSFSHPPPGPDSPAVGTMDSPASVSISSISSSRQKIMHSRSNSSSPLTSSISSKSRTRALSDSVFHSFLRSSPSPASDQVNPEADINDESSGDLVVYSSAPPPPAPIDPFHTDANTYYTPVTPPRNTSTHNRHPSTTSSTTTTTSNTALLSLQTQLSLQHELLAQYAADLSARDALVHLLTTQLSTRDAEDARKRDVLKAWKRKVVSLERCCRHLEEEVERGREEGVERSVMDEASGEAMRMMHGRIAGLERENGGLRREVEGLRDEVEQRGRWEEEGGYASVREDKLREEVGRLEELVRGREEEMQRLEETLWKRVESERELQNGIRVAKEQMEAMNGNLSIVVDEDDARKVQSASSAPLQQQQDEEWRREQERHRQVESVWRDDLRTIKEAKEEVQEMLDETRGVLRKREEELVVVKGELEAQWVRTEREGERMRGLEGTVKSLEGENETLEGEKGALEEERNTLEEKVRRLEGDWHEIDERRNELEAQVVELDERLREEEERYAAELTQREDAESRLEETESALRDTESRLEETENTLHSTESRIEELENTLHETESRLHATETRLSSLELEHKFALENTTRLEDQLREREADLTTVTARLKHTSLQHEESLSQLTSLQRDQTRLIDSHSRELSAAHTDQSLLDRLARGKAEAEVEMGVVKERVGALKGEVERLRRQIHELQQESADKEVRIVQIVKERERDREDVAGLNIALDSKQQELELLKRRLGLRGTAGSTPAQPSKVAPSASHHRRDSSIFTTPGMPRPRPSSVVSDVSTSSRKSTESNAKTPMMTKLPGLNTKAAGSVTRPSSAASTASTSSRVTKPGPARGIEGSMGPPPSTGRQNSAPAGRVSAAGTPTPLARTSSASSSLGGLGRSMSGASGSKKLAASTSTVGAPRRVASLANTKPSANGKAGPRASSGGGVTSPPPTTATRMKTNGVMPSAPTTTPVVEETETENEDDSEKTVEMDRTAKRRSLLPTPTAPMSA